MLLLLFDALLGRGVIAVLDNLHTLSWLWLLANTAAKETDDSRIKQILDFLNNNPMIGWGIAGFTAIGLVTAKLAKWTVDLDRIIQFVQKRLSRKEPKFTEAQRQKAREDLIEILLKQVVKRLEDSLHHKIRIDLKREEQRQRVGQVNLAPVQDKEIFENFIKLGLKLFTSSTPTEPVNPNKSTRELFEQEDIQGRLLILGEPGSGKTNELLVLARDLLIQAQQSPKKPIPVILELSEWKTGNREKCFFDWLVQQLLNKYNIPRGVSEHWIRHQQLLPLLDGLDELRRVDDFDEISTKTLDKHQLANQIQCVRDIKAFLDIYSLPLVICCRRKEYEALEAQGEYLNRLNGAIYLQALEDEQIQDYLQKLNRDSLWETLQKNPKLLELAHSPLFLLIMVVAYQGQHIRSTEELLDTYIQKQLNELNNQGAYPPGKSPMPKQTHHYLSWLASKLDYEGTTEFLIEELQPSWLDENNLQHYRWIIGLIGGVIFGLIDGLIGVLLFGWIPGLIDGASGGIIFGVILGLFGGLVDSLSMSLFVGLYAGLCVGLSDGIVIAIVSGIKNGLTCGQITGLMSSLWFVLITGSYGRPNEIQSSELVNFSWSSFYKKGLIFGLIGLLSGRVSGGGLTATLGAGLIGVLIGSIETLEIYIRNKTKPNQGIKNSLKNGSLVGLIHGLLYGLIVGQDIGLIYGLSTGLMIAPIGGLVGGLSAIPKHLALRMKLYQAGCSPWNYARFLEHAENHRFIQRTGSRYRFVHDLLRKRFAATLKQP